MSDINCICCKKSCKNNNKNVFDEKLLISLQENEESNSNITLKKAIELITCYTISEIGKPILCETCFHKVESYIKFRSQLINLFEKFDETQTLDPKPSGSENVDVTNISLFSKISNTGSNILENIMSIKKNNASSTLNCSNLSSSDTENDSSCTNVLNFLHCVNNGSDYSSDIEDNLNINASPSKNQKSDIESDVNVCSGEDDEILELSVEPKYNETINVSSTESEDDYDYGPTFKRIKVSDKTISLPMLS
ncbi:hypothetical protein PUN28_001488 [Cardiocondyla obscurior]|uniref:ZAD domain-containing protein n=1 Tax=Cardiocondyla obscurior TaxID=286306 RepID=A0AAW2H584_9HYME